jgi:hypothetical protein
MGEHWKPSRCKMVVVLEEHVNELVIHTDPARPQAWRREPFHADIRRWARVGAGRGLRVVVWEDDRKIIISPDRPAVSQMGHLAP